MSARHQLIGAVKLVALLIIPSVTALWGVGIGHAGAMRKVVESCHTAVPFALAGEQLLCVNREGLTNLLRNYDQTKKKQKETPL